MTTAAIAEPTPGAGDQLVLRLLPARPGHGGLVLRVRVLPAALLLAAVQLLLTGSRLARSWWYQDDFSILAGAAGRPLSPGLLLSDYNGHLIPGSWAVAWAADRIAPLQWWPAALFTLVLVAATDLMLLALLGRLFGFRPAVLLPYAVFCSTSLVLTSTLWWAAAMQWLPVSLSLVTALWFHAGYLRTRRPADAVGAVLAVAGGLLFFEKALTTLVVLALFTVGYGVPGPLWRRPWRALRQHWAYWLAQAALGGGYTWLYLSRATIDTGAPVKSADVVEVTRLMILETLLPSLVGGPLSWYSTPATTIASWPHPAPVLIVVAAALTVAAVVGSLVLVRGAWRAWLLLLVYLGISVALVAVARLGFIGPFVGRDHRYLTDLAVLAPLALALAWLPLRDGLDRADPRTSPADPQAGQVDLQASPANPLVSPTGTLVSPTGTLVSPADARASPRAVRRQAWRSRLRARLDQRSGMLAATAAVVVLVLTAGGIVSGEAFMRTWSTNPSQAYFDNLRADLAAHPGPVYLFGDEVVPDLIMTPTFLEARQLARVTRPLEVRPVVSPAVPSFSIVDPSGHLHDGMVRGMKATIATNAPVCAATDAPATVRLPATPGTGVWKLRLGYFTNRQTTARVSIGSNPPVTMRLERGLHEVFVSLQAGGSNRIRMDSLDAGAAACIGSATLGLPVPRS